MQSDQREGKDIFVRSLPRIDNIQIRSPEFSRKRARWLNGLNKSQEAGMDVLEYWRPSVDWSRFSQGPLTDHMWRLFCEHVELCHACMHWEEAARGLRLVPHAQSINAERKYKNKRQLAEHKRNIQRSEEYRNRAAFLADEKIAEMSYLLNREGVTPDGKLCVSLRVALGYPSRGQWTRCKIGAFTEFDASKELEGTVDKIADRWCRNAGFT